MVVSFLVLDDTMRSFWDTAFPFWNMPISRMKMCYQEYSSAGRIVPHSNVTAYISIWWNRPFGLYDPMTLVRFVFSAIFPFSYSR